MAFCDIYDGTKTEQIHLCNGITLSFQEISCGFNLIYTNLFMVDCETSYTTYINHSRHLIPDGIHRHEGMREEPGISSIMLSAKQ